MGRILIVDDERSIRKTFEAFLEKEGHTVHLAENVEEALKILNTYPDSPYKDSLKTMVNYVIERKN